MSDMLDHRPRARWRLRFWATGLLAICISVQPIAGEGPARGIDRNEPMPKRFAIGLVVGSTVTPDFRTGHTQTFMSVSFDPAGVRHPYSQSLYSRSAAERPIVGALLEQKLSRKLSLQAAVLYRELTYDWESVYADSDGRAFLPSGLGSTLANSGSVGLDIWEIPLTVRHEFPALSQKTSGVRPFIGIGPSFWIEKASVKFADRGLGATAVAGFNAPWKRWIVTPQINYTRWATNGSLGISKNQVQLMLAFTF